jgi:hypothetical protein
MKCTKIASVSKVRVALEVVPEEPFHHHMSLESPPNKTSRTGVLSRLETNNVGANQFSLSLGQKLDDVSLSEKP